MLQIDQGAILHPGLKNADIKKIVGQRFSAILEIINAIIVGVVPMVGRTGELGPVAIVGLKMMRAQKQALIPMNGQVLHGTSAVSVVDLGGGREKRERAPRRSIVSLEYPTPSSL